MFGRIQGDTRNANTVLNCAWTLFLLEVSNPDFWGGKYPMAVPRLPPIYFCDWILFFLGLDSLVLDSLPCVSIQSLAASQFEYSVFHDVSV